jgi:negative regulator of sigma-B (phosphoserine phosphatase)
MRQTRGAVLTILKIYFDKQIVEYCSVGNIKTTLILSSGVCKQPIPFSGFLACHKKKFRTQKMTIDKNSMILSYSDGIRLTSRKCKELSNIGTPSKVIQAIADMHLEDLDDTTCIIGKIK